MVELEKSNWHNAIMWDEELENEITIAFEANAHLYNFQIFKWRWILTYFHVVIKIARKWMKKDINTSLCYSHKS